MKSLKNGTVLFDTDNNPIHAHGGFMLFFNGFYYWYSEDRRDATYVSCYRSKDLENREARGAILTVNSPVSPLSFYFAPLNIEGDTVTMDPCDTYTLTAENGLQVVSH